MYFMGDFNCHSQYWWPAGDTNAEGTELDELMSSLGLTQLISEPINLNLIKIHLTSSSFSLTNRTL